MPPRFPFSRIPYPYHMYHPRYCQAYTKSAPLSTSPKIIEKENIQNDELSKKGEINENRNNPSTNIISNLFSFIPTSIGPLNFHPEALSNNELPLFEMFGIRLFLDDIIIICILIFLYQEKVSDQTLYISLFLLLIS